MTLIQDDPALFPPTDWLPAETTGHQRQIIRPVDWKHKPAGARTWVPWPGFQRRMLASSAFECLGGGAAGPGKTDILLLLWLRFADRPWMKVLLMRRTEPELQEMKDRAEQYYKPFGARWVETRKRWEFPAGGWIRMGYAERYAQLERHMGFEYSGVGWDELGQVPGERWWTRIISRIRSSDPEAQRYLMARATANPGGEGHAWVKRRFIGPCGRDGGHIYVNPRTGYSRQFCPGTLDDNPSVDPGYAARLMDLPDRERKALRFGDWDAAEGIAYEELDWEIHGREALRDVPPHWWQFGTFDWGFTHYAVFIWWGVDEVGLWHVIDAIWMRRLLPTAIAETVAEQVPLHNLATVWCSPDCFNTDASKSDSNPVIADKLTAAGWPVQKANTDRIQRLALGRELISYRARGPGGTDVMPGCVFHDTPGVRRLFDQLQAMVTDPDAPNKVLKVDLEPGQLEGGDDGADAWSFGPVSYAALAEKPEGRGASMADPDALMATQERGRRHKSTLVDNEEHGLDLPDVGDDPLGTGDSYWEVL